MRTPVIPDLRNVKFKVLKNVVKVLERDEAKSALSRNGITPVSESLDILKVIIASLYLELETSYFIQELKRSKRLERVMDLSFTLRLVKYMTSWLGWRKSLQKVYRAGGKLSVRCSR